MSRSIEGVTLLGSVVVGVDGSDHAERALRWAAEQASLEHRRLAVVSVGDNAGNLADDAVAAAQLLHPDLSVVGSAVSGGPAPWVSAIEVDPCGPAGSRGYSHSGAEEKDRTRNDLLAAGGGTVIRLRLGATEGAHIGDRDIIIESSGFTQAAQSALLEAIEDYREQRPARMRVVRKGKTPTAAARRSHIVNIGLDRYSDDTYWFTWYPDLDSPENHKYRLAADGRYLYGSNGRGSAFVAEVGFHQVDRADWKTQLTDYLAGKTPADLRCTSKWPWSPGPADRPAGRRLTRR